MLMPSKSTTASDGGTVAEPGSTTRGSCQTMPLLHSWRCFGLSLDLSLDLESLASSARAMAAAVRQRTDMMLLRKCMVGVSEAAGTGGGSIARNPAKEASERADGMQAFVESPFVASQRPATCPKRTRNRPERAHNRPQPPPTASQPASTDTNRTIDSGHL